MDPGFAQLRAKNETEKGQRVEISFINETAPWSSTTKIKVQFIDHHDQAELELKAQDFYELFEEESTDRMSSALVSKMAFAKYFTHDNQRVKLQLADIIAGRRPVTHTETDAFFLEYDTEGDGEVGFDELNYQLQNREMKPLHESMRMGFENVFKELTAEPMDQLLHTARTQGLDELELYVYRHLGNLEKERATLASALAAKKAATSIAGAKPKLTSHYMTGQSYPHDEYAFSLVNLQAKKSLTQAIYAKDKELQTKTEVDLEEWARLVNVPQYEIEFIMRYQPKNKRLKKKSGRESKLSSFLETPKTPQKEKIALKWLQEVADVLYERDHDLTLLREKLLRSVIVQKREDQMKKNMTQLRKEASKVGMSSLTTSVLRPDGSRMQLTDKKALLRDAIQKHRIIYRDGVHCAETKLGTCDTNADCDDLSTCIEQKLPQCPLLANVTVDPGCFVKNCTCKPGFCAVDGMCKEQANIWGKFMREGPIGLLQRDRWWEAESRSRTCLYVRQASIGFNIENISCNDPAATTFMAAYDEHNVGFIKTPATSKFGPSFYDLCLGIDSNNLDPTGRVEITLQRCASPHALVLRLPWGGNKGHITLATNPNLCIGFRRHPDKPGDASRLPLHMDKCDAKGFDNYFHLPPEWISEGGDFERLYPQKIREFKKPAVECRNFVGVRCGPRAPCPTTSNSECFMGQCVCLNKLCAEDGVCKAVATTSKTSVNGTSNIMKDFGKKPGELITFDRPQSE